MAWQTVGSIRGPKGDTGDTGAKGDKGDTGPAGVGISITGSVNSYSLLPSNLGISDAGKAWEVLADGKLYVWTGTQFPADGAGSQFRGPKGDTGNTGDKGDTGNTGATGTRGSLWWTGTGAPGVINGSLAGDIYLDTDTGSIYQLS